jgi:hypothetical protein
MRVLGAIMIVLGLLFCLTVIGAVIGIPMMLIGLGLVVAGGNRSVVVHVTQNTPQYHPHVQPQHPPHPTIPPMGHAQPPPLPSSAMEGSDGAFPS